MARLWSSGFELQSATSGVEWDTTTGSPTINTTTKRTGAAALRCNPSAAAWYISHAVLSAADVAAHVYLRAYIYVASAPAASTMLMCWADSAAATTGFYGIKMTSSRTLLVTSSGGTTGTASAAVPLNTWTRIELEYDDTANTATGYLNGTSWATLSAADLGGGNYARWGVITATTADIYFDDCAINNASGAAQAGLPGAGSIVHISPDSTGDNAGFATTVGGSSNWGRVSEVTPDDATTYNASTATGTTTIDDFNCGSRSGAGIGASDTITLVAVGARVGSNAVTAASIVTRVKSQASGTLLESASTSVALNGWSTHAAAVPKIHKLVSYTDPQAGGSWTPTLIDSMQIGYRGDVSQSTARRVSTLWALVEFVPSTGTAYTQTVTAAATLNPVLKRRVGATRTRAVTAAPVLSRRVAAKRPVTVTTARVVLRRVGRTVTSTVTTAPVLRRRPGKLAATAVTTVVTLRRSPRRLSTVLVAASATIRRRPAAARKVTVTAAPVLRRSVSARRVAAVTLTAARSASRVLARTYTQVVTTAAPLVRQVRARRVVTEVSAATVVRRLSVRRTVAAALTPKLFRRIGRKTTTAITAAGSVRRQVGRNATASVVTTRTLAVGRALRTTLTAVVSLSAAVRRRAGRVPRVTVTVAPSRRVRLGRPLPVTMATAATVRRQAGRRLQVGVTAAGATRRRVARKVTAEVTATASTAVRRVAIMLFAALVGLTPSVKRRAGRLAKTTVVTAPARKARVARTVTVAVAAGAVIRRQLTRRAVTAVGAAGKVVRQARPAARTAAVTLVGKSTRQVGVRRTTLVTAAASRRVQAGRRLTAAITAAATVRRRIGRRLAALVTAAAHAAITKVLLLVLYATITLTTRLTRRVAARRTALVTTTGNRLLRAGRRAATVVTAAGSVRRRVGKRITVVVTAAAHTLAGRFLLLTVHAAVALTGRLVRRVAARRAALVTVPAARSVRVGKVVKATAGTHPVLFAGRALLAQAVVHAAASVRRGIRRRLAAVVTTAASAVRSAGGAPFTGVFTLGRLFAKWFTQAIATTGSRFTVPHAKWLFGGPTVSAIPVISTEYLRVPVSATTAGQPVNPTLDVVEFAFLSSGVAEPAEPDWHTGGWDAPGTGYVAQVLVGPNGGVTLAGGTWYVWVRLTASPEKVVRQVGQLQIV